MDAKNNDASVIFWGNESKSGAGAKLLKLK